MWALYYQFCSFYCLFYLSTYMLIRCTYALFHIIFTMALWRDAIFSIRQGSGVRVSSKGQSWDSSLNPESRILSTLLWYSLPHCWFCFGFSLHGIKIWKRNRKHPFIIHHSQVWFFFYLLWSFRNIYWKTW